MSSKNRFGLTSPLSNMDIEEAALKHYYKAWRTLNQNTKSPFIALDNSFLNKYLKDLEPGPLKLYLYFCFAANNEHGHSWHGIQRIADYFGTQTRTIDNWIKVLVEKDLIYRAQKGQRSHTTYLLPFSNAIIVHPAPRKRSEDNQGLLDDLVKNIRELEFVYGRIIKVFHLFQWPSSKGKPANRDESVQYLLIITKRNNDVLIGHFHTLRKSDHLSVNRLDIEEPSVFESPFILDDSNIIGLALPSFPAVYTKSALKDLLSLVDELSTIEDWEIEDRPKLFYGNKDEVLHDEEIEEELEEEEEIDEEEVDEEIENE